MITPNNVGGGRPVVRVVVQTGALNPVHRGHVMMLEKAKLTLEAHNPNIPVVAGFLSPSHELYARPKSEYGGHAYFSSEHRATMCDLSTEDSTWLSCGRWEMSQDGFWPDFPEVANNLASHLGSFDSISSKVEVEVFYVCGTDHFTKCGLKTGMGRIGIVVVPRAEDHVPQDCTDKRIFVASITALKTEGSDGITTADLSSTKVRSALVESASIAELEKMVYPGVARFLFTGPAAAIGRPPAPASASSLATQLKAMGFNEEQVEGAVQHNQTAEQAVNWILGQENSAPPAPQSPEGPAPALLQIQKRHKRHILISASALAHQWRSASSELPDTMEQLTSLYNSALMFFGSKRSWLFPQSDTEKAESRLQGSYEPPAFPQPLLDLIKEKELRQPPEVYFLKPPGLNYKGFGHGCHARDELAPAFAGASAWLQRHNLNPLILDSVWWTTKYSTETESFTGVSGKAVVENYMIGEHDYNPCIELLYQSNPGTVQPALLAPLN